MRRSVSMMVVLGLLAGCQQPVARLNAPPHGTTENQSELSSEYAHMIDNALLDSMTVSDVHFLPHRAQLNSLGEERLARLALLMEMYGGQLNFSTNTDEKLAEERTATIIAFLEETGLDVAATTPVLAMSAGRGMDAGQAIEIKVNEGTYKPKKSSAGASTGGATGGGTK